MVEKDGYLQYFDEAWKKIIEVFFLHLLQFFIPELYKDVDLIKAPSFLDKEIERLSRKSKRGAKLVDKLVKICLKDGFEQWILVHIEIQGYADKKFPERMFRYFYRIFDKYDEKIVSLALITGIKKGALDGRFEIETYGSGVVFRYLSHRLMDYDRNELEKSDNPIALVILACQGREEAKKKGEAFNIKLRLIRSMYEKGYSQEYIIALFEFLDWIIILDEKEEELILEEIKEIEGVKKMPYVSNMERVIRKKAITEGRIEGKIEGEKELILEALYERFEEVPEDIAEFVNAIGDENKLKVLFHTAIKCVSLDEFKRSVKRYV